MLLCKRNQNTAALKIRNPKLWGRFTSDFPENYYAVNFAYALKMQKAVIMFVKRNKFDQIRIDELCNCIRKNLITELTENITNNQ